LAAIVKFFAEEKRKPEKKSIHRELDAEEGETIRQDARDFKSFKRCDALLFGLWLCHGLLLLVCCIKLIL
jgi:hypothetical protein